MPAGGDSGSCLRVRFEANDVEERKGKVESQVNEQQMKDTNGSKTRLYTDQCIAFVSNFNFKAKDENLQKFFSDVGGVGLWSLFLGWAQ